jgi:hypothetical protein
VQSVAPFNDILNTAIEENRLIWGGFQIRDVEMFLLRKYSSLWAVYGTIRK